jgi:site-specific DNA-methyltransferase (adenine-specific)
MKLGKIELTNEDNMVMMARYPDKYFDLAIVDPPYFNGPDKLGYFGARLSPAGAYREQYKKIDSWSIPDKRYFNELKGVSENQIIWGANYYDFIGQPFKTPRGKEIHQWIKDNPVGWIIWDKCNGNSSFNDYELAWTSFDRPTVIFKYVWNGMMQGKSIEQGDITQGNKKLNEKRIHPTQKPVNLYKWILQEYAKPGQKIIDANFGSGSIGIACHDMDFELVACDIDKNSFEAAGQRIIHHQNQLTIFDMMRIA